MAKERKHLERYNCKTKTRATGNIKVIMEMIAMISIRPIGLFFSNGYGSCLPATRIKLHYDMNVNAISLLKVLYNKSLH